jgi:polyphosphate kinase
VTKPGDSHVIHTTSFTRIFYFANGAQDPADGEYYIGSADWMFRNLSKRIEVVTPILAVGPKQRLWEILDICRRDQRESWVLDPDGKYEQLRPASGSIGSEAERGRDRAQKGQSAEGTERGRRARKGQARKGQTSAEGTRDRQARKGQARKGQTGRLLI